MSRLDRDEHKVAVAKKTAAPMPPTIASTLPPDQDPATGQGAPL